MLILFMEVLQQANRGLTYFGRATIQLGLLRNNITNSDYYYRIIIASVAKTKNHGNLPDVILFS